MLCIFTLLAFRGVQQPAVTKPGFWGQILALVLVFIAWFLGNASIPGFVFVCDVTICSVLLVKYALVKFGHAFEGFKGRYALFRLKLKRKFLIFIVIFFRLFFV